MQRIGDFLELANISPVVQLADVKYSARLEKLSDELISLVDSYLIVEGANAPAMHGLLSALPNGGAFLISGVYGTGKSHLLAVLGLLSEFPDTRLRLAKRNPALTSLLQRLNNRRFFVTYISLDEFDPTAWALETIVSREIDVEAKRKNFSVQTDTSARGEWISDVFFAIQSNGFSGLVILLDELAMFINSKSGPELNRDASFLQFLAQATKRMPLILVGSLQRGIEDLQTIQPYALSQIRDRFQQTWVLGFAHALPLISTVLLIKHHDSDLRERLGELRERMNWQTRFSTDELFSCYPLHPLTVRLLERTVGAFFSRTRSIVTFVQSSVADRLDAKWDELIGPDALLDHFISDMQVHPQLRPFAQQVIPYFENLSPNDELNDLKMKSLRIVKALLMFQIGGWEPSAQTVADALMINPQNCWELLESLRSEANFVDVVRRTGSTDDTYRIDPQITAVESLRRKLSEMVQSLTEGDQRLLRFAWECHSDDWFLPPLFEPRTFQTNWMQTKRKLTVTAIDLRQLTKIKLQQTVANLSSTHTKECLQIFIAIPFEIEQQAVQFTKLLKEMADERFSYAIVSLIPRSPSKAEQLRWRENTAVWLLSQDLSLTESELGMAMFERLKEMLPARKWETCRLIQRLYNEGTILMKSPSGSLEEKISFGSNGVSSDNLFQTVAQIALPKVFPKFSDIAPLKEASAQTYQSLTQLILTFSPDETLGANAQRWLELIAMRLGIISKKNGNLVVTLPSNELTETILQTVGNGISYRQLEAKFAKNEFGLTHEQCQLLIAALLRTGTLTAFDRRGAQLIFDKPNVSLFHSIATLKPSKLLSVDEWNFVRLLISSWLGENLPEKLTAETQQQIWLQLRKRAKEWQLLALDLNERLNQWMKELGQTIHQWQTVWESFQLNSELTSMLAKPINAFDGLRQFSKWVQTKGLTFDQLESWRNNFEAAGQFLSSSSEFLSSLRYLNSLSSMKLPKALDQTRQTLLTQLQSGEKFLSNWREWQNSFNGFVKTYIEAYLEHHERIYSSQSFKKIQDLKQSLMVQLLTRLADLPDSPNDGFKALQKLQRVVEKQCFETRLTLRPLLQSSPICPRCGLGLNETPAIDLDAIASEIAKASKNLKAWFCSSEQRQKLKRFAEFSQSSERAVVDKVLKLSPSSPDDEWQIIFAVSSTLQTALSPHTVVEVNLGELCKLLEERYLTFDEAVRIFRNWLNEKAISQETRFRFIKTSKTDEVNKI